MPWTYSAGQTWRKRRIEQRRQERSEEKKRREELFEELERGRLEAIRECEQSKQRQAQYNQDRLQNQLDNRRKNRIRDLSRLLNRLTVLRDLRRKKLEAQGHFVAEVGNEFYDKIKAWNDARESAEDQASHHGQQSDADTLVVNPQDRWESTELDTDAYRYWCQGMQTTDALRRVRRQWDRFIAKEEDDSVGIQGKVPPFFVDPAPPADSFWALYLAQDSD